MERTDQYPLLAKVPEEKEEEERGKEKEDPYRDRDHQGKERRVLEDQCIPREDQGHQEVDEHIRQEAEGNRIHQEEPR